MTSDTSIAGRANEHLGLVIAGAGVVVIAFRLFAVATFSTDTALAILQIAGTAEVVVGTLMTLLPLALMIALAFVEATILIHSGPRWGFVALVVTALVLAIAVSFVPYGPGTGAFYLVMLPAAFVGRWAIRRRPTPLAAEVASVKRTWMRALAVLLAAPITVNGLLSPDPWLPAEVVESQSGTFVGYVLDSDSDGAAVLIESTRRIVHIAPITRRVLCDAEPDENDGSIAGALGLAVDANRYAPCPPASVS